MHCRPLWCMHCRGGSACTAGVAVHALQGGQCMHCRGCGACTAGGAVHALQGWQCMHCGGASASLLHCFPIKRNQMSHALRSHSAYITCAPAAL